MYIARLSFSFSFILFLLRRYPSFFRAFYFLPLLIAFSRRHSRHYPIFRPRRISQYFFNVIVVKYNNRLLRKIKKSLSRCYITINKNNLCNIFANNSDKYEYYEYSNSFKLLNIPHEIDCLLIKSAI